MQFDGVIIGYLNFLPISLSFLLHALKIDLLKKIIFVYYVLLYTLVYFLLIADIPYFLNFYSHITISIFNWINTPVMMLKQVISDRTFMFFLLAFLLFISAYIYLLKRILLNKSEEKTLPFFSNILILIFFLMLNFAISRGRIDSPLKESHACLTGNSYFNQLPLNGAFTFYKSIDYRTNFYDYDYAMDVVKRSLYIENTEPSISRKITFENQTCNKYNIVLIIMESMTTYNTGFKGNTLTKELDTIAQNGITFINTWSTGKHTSSGIYSVLYSYPTIWSRRPTSSSEKTTYCGLPGTLKKLGYYNAFITTQSLSFDNLQEFIPANHFDTIIGIGSFNKKDVVSLYGVPDHIMFDYGVKYINQSVKNGPIFTCFLTTSNHSPYVVPDNIPFNSNYSDISKKIVEYSSWSIGQFIKQCSQYEWFKNTLFVLVGDHGFLVKPDTNFVPLCLHNVPLIFYNPSLLDTAYTSNKLCLQVDVFPMIMSLLKCNYVNNSFGIDLFQQNRRFVYYSEDHSIVCQNDSFQVLINKSGNAEILILKNLPIPENYMNEIKEKMKEYALTHLQIANYLISKRQTNCEN